MKLPVSKLNFSLSNAPFVECKKRMEAATEGAKKIAVGAGTGGLAYEKSFLKIKTALRQGKNLEGILVSPIDLRAMAFLFNDVDYVDRINLTPSLLQKVDEIRSQPSRLLVDAIYSHYLHKYDFLKFPLVVARWLKRAKNRRDGLSREVEHLLDDNGPKWLAEESQRQGRDFDEQVKRVELDLYRSGRFLTVAKNIYYLSVLSQLQKLDLKLFLEALKNFSYQVGNEELKRMYPARKQFMEGMLNKQLVTGTRLFLSHDAECYLKDNYKPEHLPSYSCVNGAQSVIHIQLDSVQMIEGSHNCKLWIYERLDPSAIVFDYSKNQVSYQSLTGGLRDQMVMLGVYHKEDITHNPSNFNWQHKAIKALQDLGVAIEPKDVLMEGDYRKYKRLYGV